MGSHRQSIYGMVRETDSSGHLMINYCAAAVVRLEAGGESFEEAQVEKKNYAITIPPIS